MNEQTPKLVGHAKEIWHAGVAAVDSAKLVNAAVRLTAGRLYIGPHSFALDTIRRIIVVGAGKAGAGMAQGLLHALGDQLPRAKHLTGWINVPDDCARDLPWIQLHPARPAGENVPTNRVMFGTRRILELVRECSPDDLCICLISGGGSALLDLPVPPITLDEQVAMTEFLSGAQANIRQLNTVRKQISEVKGGRLAAACQAPLVSLIISDVLGNPIDVIASGPTAVDSSTRDDALSILRHFDPDETKVAKSIYSVLRNASRAVIGPSDLSHVNNVIVGSLSIAVEAAAARARQLGYQTESRVSESLEGLAEDVGRELAKQLNQLQAQQGGQAWIEGGEPVVRLVDSTIRGLGGRNQQVVLAFADKLAQKNLKCMKSFCLISGGTDGEDGPTDASGAWLDETSLSEIKRLGLDPSHYLAHNDAYHFFERLGTLLKTGPTHTNVCDLRILLCG